MPALISHYAMAKRVLKKRIEAGDVPVDQTAFLIGAQGPDMLYFHRVMPWHTGISCAREGRLLHKLRPARTVDAFAAFRPLADDTQKSYIDGFLCHYALDRTAHPYVLYWQRVLEKRDPSYSPHYNQYHYRMESALDSIVVRRETGLPIDRFDLTWVVPPTTAGQNDAIGRLYGAILETLFGLSIDRRQLSFLVPDLRLVARGLNDPHLIKQKLLHLPESILPLGPIASSLMRPLDTDDFDYADLAHAPWHNPMDKTIKSRDSYFDLEETAIRDADRMISQLHAGADGLTITENRGFATDLDLDEMHIRF